MPKIPAGKKQQLVNHTLLVIQHCILSGIPVKTRNFSFTTYRYQKNYRGKTSVKNKMPYFITTYNSDLVFNRPLKHNSRNCIKTFKYRALHIRPLISQIQNPGLKKS